MGIETIALIISIILGIISAVITYVMSDKSTPEKKKAALGMALGVGAAVGTLAHASGLSDSIASGFSDSASTNSGNPFSGNPTDEQVKPDGTIRQWYSDGYYDIKTDGTTAAYNLDGTPRSLVATGSGLTSANVGKTGNGRILGATATAPLTDTTGTSSSTTSWYEKLGLVGGAAVLGSVVSGIPLWVWLAGGVALILIMGD